MKEIIISANEDRQRLDRFLKKYMCNAPLSLLYKAIRVDVKVNGKRAKEDTMLVQGDVVQLYMSDEDVERYTKKRKVTTAKRQFTVSYEDDNILVVNKPFGLLVHGDASEKKDTLANQVVDYLIETGAYVPRIERTFTPSPVHRLDRNTTGLVVFGKNAEALRVLSKMLKEDGYVKKFYYTIVSGELKRELHLKNKLLKDEAANKVSVLPISSEQGKYIETIARPIASNGGFTLVMVELVTGRSHQIRAHLMSAGYPLIGDVKYGDPRANAAVRRRFSLTTQLLHAGKLQVTSAPQPLEYLTGKVFSSPLPPTWDGIETTLFGKEIIENGIE